MGWGNLKVVYQVMDNYSQFSFKVVKFSKVTTNTELMNTEPLLLVQIQGY